MPICGLIAGLISLSWAAETKKNYICNLTLVNKFFEGHAVFLP
jgi:hypothetical protein